MADRIYTGIINVSVVGKVPSAIKILTFPQQIGLVNVGCRTSAREYCDVPFRRIAEKSSPRKCGKGLRNALPSYYVRMKFEGDGSNRRNRRSIKNIGFRAFYVDHEHGWLHFLQ